MAVTTEAFQRLLNAVSAQDVAFGDVNDLLRNNDLPTATSWDKLVAKLLELASDGRDTAFAVLTQLLTNHVTCGDKDLHIFDLEAAEVMEIESAFKLLFPQPSIYRDAFPKAVSASILSAANTAPILTQKIERDNGDISLIFCSHRTDFDKTKYKYNEVSTAVQQAFNGFDSFIAVKRIDYQIFDVVNFRKSTRRLEILIDQPNRIKEDETSADRCLLLLGQLASTCNAMTKRYETNSPMNLYPCINSMYFDRTEGAIKQLAFRAPSRSKKRESVQADDDLRKEPFHAAGIEKVMIITVYDIKVTWSQLTSGNGSNAGPGWAHLKTPINSLSQEGAYVRTAQVHASNDNAIACIANKLTKHST